jgi:N-formylglutamate amidohydrolase
MQMRDSPPPFRRLGPDRPGSPVVISVPHAGRAYSDGLLASARLPRSRLETLEDRLVDRLVWRAVEGGAVALIADVPRAEIDLNRDERELDPAMVQPRPPAASTLESPRTRGGLGLIPARIAGSGAIWRQRIAAAEVARRVEHIHRPYHAALESELQAARARFGIAILLDCHSMPPRGIDGEAPVVLGDRHGGSMAEGLVAAAERAARGAGFRVARNAPYAGGHITERHGRPAGGVHALQLELDRSLYLAPDLRSTGAGFDRVARLIAAVAEALADAALDPPEAIAAE